MRALRFHGNQDIRLDDVPEPIVKPGWVKIKNSWCGICGTDIHEFLHGPRMVPTKPHIVTGESLPCILGHEISGIIVEVGANVPDFKVGDRVVVETVLYDNTCYACKLKSPGLCSTRGFIGYTGYGGGFADYICVQAKSLHKLPDSISTEVGALVEPLSVAWQAVKVSGIRPGQSALILGAGAIGLAVLLCLQAHDISTILVSEIFESKIKYAEDLGATKVLHPVYQDIADESKKLCDGLGPDVVFECAGVQKSMDAALASVRILGSVVNLAMWRETATFNPNIFLTKQIRWIGTAVYSQDVFEEVIDAIVAGKIRQPERLITARVPLEDVILGGFLRTAQSDDIKILVSP